MLNASEKAAFPYIGKDILTFQSNSRQVPASTTSGIDTIIFT